MACCQHAFCSLLHTTMCDECVCSVVTVEAILFLISLCKNTQFEYLCPLTGKLTLHFLSCYYVGRWWQRLDVRNEGEEEETYLQQTRKEADVRLFYSYVHIIKTEEAENTK